jgi:hydroxypyruvate isomerase
MERRKFIKRTLAASAAAGLATAGLGKQALAPASNKAKFKLKYAPGFNAFPELAGKDPVDFIRFCNDQGFRAVFDNGLANKEPSLQEKIGAELSRFNMELGPFGVPGKEGRMSLVYSDSESREKWKKGMYDAIETSKRTGGKYALIVPGKLDTKLEMDYQTANVIDGLRELSEIAEKDGVVIVIEPLNRWNHPGLFLTRIPQAYAICRAVDSPSCKIVNDIYHQQITEGNIIPNIDRAWGEIAAFHIGDNPGRKEPGTGEINYLNIFKHIHKKGYQGVLCMEHGRSIPGAEGERALIEAYRSVDDY